MESYLCYLSVYKKEDYLTLNLNYGSRKNIKDSDMDQKQQQLSFGADKKGCDWLMNYWGGIQSGLRYCQAEKTTWI